MVGVDPVDHSLVVDREQSPDPSEAVAFEVELERRPLGLVVVAERARSGRVLAAALLALIALVLSVREAGFNLARSILAMGASNHAGSYNTISFDLDNPPNYSTLTIL